MTPDPTPSKAARRAADAIWQTHDADGPPEAIAAIIERETGAGEAHNLIWLMVPYLDPDASELRDMAMKLLQRFNQD